jgi:hypothetical protein
MGISAQGAEHLTMKIGRAYKHAREFDSFLATDARRVEGYRAEDGMETLSYSLPELMKATAEGEFDHALHIAILMLAVAKGAVRTP